MRHDDKLWATEFIQCGHVGSIQPDIEHLRKVLTLLPNGWRIVEATDEHFAMLLEDSRCELCTVTPADLARGEAKARRLGWIS